MEFQGSVIKSYAKKALSANYWPMVGFCLLYYVFVFAINYLSKIPTVGNGLYFIALVFVGPIISASFTLQLYWTYHSGEAPKVSHLFEGFKGHRYWHVIGGTWYMTLFIFLWSLLLFIPGIIKSIAYSMTPYILMDQPEISATDALKKSMAMTKGYKWDIFVFYLSFIGWLLLAGITFGIVGIFYVIPYYTLSLAGIYDFLKSNDTAASTAAEEEITE
ncbi:MAG: DUF975 family protein [Pseudobutyrivibrio sp.]|nr:DUF975 family protein [Pseudobutyrivibrio sp.]